MMPSMLRTPVLLSILEMIVEFCGISSRRAATSRPLLANERQ
jgi:hypothetical protein